jgi:hypothetical protein
LLKEHLARPGIGVFQLPVGLLGTFAVVKPWPNIQAAEDENIARLKNTAKQMGLRCLEITPEGEIIGGSGERVSSANCDFVINLHFDKPKNYDVFSFVALWNPLEFYLDWGYERVSRNLLSHDDFLSCGSTWADDHVRRMIRGKATHLEPKFKLYHSLSHPIFSPSPREYHLFYAGINWERLGKGKSRYQELLNLLDGTGKLRIFGPEVFQGVRVWEGYRSYRKQIPFDGTSMVEEIAQCGAALVLSSEAHKQSELMSNRLFESLAAGALIICDENAFARRHFGDSILYIDSRKSPREQFASVMQHLKWAEENSIAAVEMATAAQKIFINVFRLDLSLGSIYSGFIERKAQICERQIPASDLKPTVRVICVVDHLDTDEFERRIASVAAQTYKNFKVSIAIQKNLSDKTKEAITGSLRRHELECDYIILDYGTKISKSDGGLPLGSVLQQCFNGWIGEDYALMLTPHERVMSNHLEVLVGSALRNPNRAVYATALIVYHQNGQDKLFESCEKIEFTESNIHTIRLHRFLIDTRKIRPDVSCALPYLDELAIGALIQEQISVETPATAVYDGSASRQSGYSFRQQYSVLADYSPWLFKEHQITGYSIPSSLRGNEEFSPKALSFNGLSNDNRIELFASLLQATLPAFIIKPVFWLYDKLTGRG